jgi:hypothetical protein
VCEAGAGKLREKHTTQERGPCPVPDRNTFESAYAGHAPWDIDRPQQVFLGVAYRISGTVLDAGCGTGENALFFASRGQKVTGIDFLAEPITRANKKAAALGVMATFLVMDALARAVLGTRLGKVLENEDFWESLLLFFVNHPSLDLAQVGPVVDFLQHQKFEWKEGVSQEGVFGKHPPPRPDYTMKGRTVASILRQVEEWHRELGQDSNQPCLSWRHSPFKDFRLIEGSEALGNMRAWTITELLTSRALFLEGQAMRHCVATYAERCVRKQTSIWSMQVENQRGRHRVLTIEVDLSKRTVCQVRRKCNRLPVTAEREVMERWAGEQGLKVAELVRL